MTYFLYGPNTYELERGLRALLDGLAKKYPGVTPERLDGADTEPADLSDILQGTSLFNERRIVVLRAPSAHKALWDALEPYIGNGADTAELIIADKGADKRTKTFKALVKTAQAREYAEFGPRAQAGLATWLGEEAARQGITLAKESAGLLIDRVGYDQWALANAVTKLALVGDGSPARIRELIEPSPSANAFDIFEAALRGETDRVRLTLADLELTSDPYLLLGLLGSQAYGLALVANSSKTPAELAKLTGISAYPLQKMAPLAHKLGKARVRTAVKALAECDRDLKRSVAPPWTLVTRALLKIATS